MSDRKEFQDRYTGEESDPPEDPVDEGEGENGEDMGTNF